MSKRHNITFNKPEDPNFLKRFKEQIGYKEGPTVETKRQKFEEFSSDEEDSPVYGDDEKPQVVVLKPGDLTAEEALKEEQKIGKEEKEKPADLNQRIIFKTRSKATTDNPTDSKKTNDVPFSTATTSGAKKSSSENEPKNPEAKIKDKSKKGKKSKIAKSKLSFNDDEDEDYAGSDIE